MRKLFMTAAASAILLPLGACADQSAGTGQESEDRAQAQTENQTSAETTTAQTTYGAQPATDYTLDERAQVDMYLGKTSLSVKELLGEGIHGSSGDRIARIDDLIINANGQAENVIFLSGGIFGLGGKRGALDYDALEIAREDNYEPIVSVSLSEEGIKAAVEFETDQMNDYSLASEMIGAEVDLTDTTADEDAKAVVNDIILAENGRVEHLIVQKSLVGAGVIGAGDKYAVDYAKLSVAQGDGGGLVLDMTEAELEAAPKFAARRMAAGDNAFEKAKDGVKEMKDDVTKDKRD